MLEVAYPFGNQLTIHPLDIAGEVFEVALREVLHRGSCLKLLGKVKDGPHQVGKALVLQKVRIFQQPQEKLPFLGEKSPQCFQIDTATVNFNFDVMGTGGCFFKVACFPIRLDAIALNHGSSYLTP